MLAAGERSRPHTQRLVAHPLRQRELSSSLKQRLEKQGWVLNLSALTRGFRKTGKSNHQTTTMLLTIP